MKTQKAELVQGTPELLAGGRAGNMGAIQGGRRGDSTGRPGERIP
jgi:hypothetical protein